MCSSDLDNIYTFIWYEFCDWYIEMAKSRIYSEDEQIKIVVSAVLNYVLGTSLKLLHPFMPFVTTEIYSNLVNNEDTDLMVSNWPERKMSFEEEEKFIEKIKDVIVEIRNIRATKNIHPSKKSELIFVTNQYEKELRSEEHTSELQSR